MLLMNWYLGLVIRPIVTIREIVDAKPIGLGLLTLLVVAIANGLISIALGLDPADFEGLTEEKVDLGAGFVITTTILSAILIFVVYAVLSLLIHVVAKLFGGQGEYTNVVAGLGMLAILSLIPIAPALLDAIVAAEGETSPFGVIATLVGLGVGIWSIVLGIILIRENYRLSTGVAVLTGLVSTVAAVFIGGILFILMLIVLVLVVLGAAIAVS